MISIEEGYYAVQTKGGSGKGSYKNVRVILTLSGLAQLHLFRGFYAV